MPEATDPKMRDLDLVPEVLRRDSIYLTVRTCFRDDLERTITTIQKLEQYPEWTTQRRAEETINVLATAIASLVGLLSTPATDLTRLREAINAALRSGEAEKP